VDKSGEVDQRELQEMMLELIPGDGKTARKQQLQPQV
jgi:hypothetical protein